MSDQLGPTGTNRSLGAENSAILRPPDSAPEPDESLAGIEERFKHAHYALAIYLTGLRDFDPDDHHTSRKEYERSVQEILEVSPLRYRLLAPDLENSEISEDAVRVLVHDINGVEFTGVGYSHEHEQSTIFLQPENADEIEIPISLFEGDISIEII